MKVYIDGGVGIYIGDVGIVERLRGELVFFRVVFIEVCFYRLGVRGSREF